ncbi:MAG: AMIN domain-containing protein, partial [Gammaproteobacteria bacterium]|nr:AMIN domain-containing protein [Gammaproteobacteria bacterium]
MNVSHHKSAFIAVLMLSMMAAPALFAASIDEIRIWRAPDHTRLVFDLSDGVQYSLFTLDNPHRVVIDIADSEMNDDFSGLDFGDSPISELRSGVREGDDLRIVLDLSAEVNPSSFILEPNSELGDRLVVDLYDLGTTNSSTPITLTPVPDRSQDRREIVVAISAGHGGEDPGSIGYDRRIKEKNVTLA